jgi:hypothetical protein
LRQCLGCRKHKQANANQTYFVTIQRYFIQK